MGRILCRTPSVRGITLPGDRSVSVSGPGPAGASAGSGAHRPALGPVAGRFTKFTTQEGGMAEGSHDWRVGLARKVVNEIEHLISAFHRSSHGRIQIEVARSDGRVDYLYVGGQILVRDEHLERVLEIIEPETPETERRRVWNDPERVRRVIEGVVLLTLGEQGPLVQDALGS